MKRLLFATLATIVLTMTLARAQAPVNQPIRQPLGPAPPSGSAAPPPVVLAPPAPAGLPSTIVVPEGSTITVFNQGVRQDYARHSVQGNVRTFDSGTSRMTLQDGTVVTFPQNFAFTQVPEVGQPVKLTYFTDQNGNNIGTAIDSGTGRQ